jgi:hypothetical protein
MSFTAHGLWIGTRTGLSLVAAALIAVSGPGRPANAVAFDIAADVPEDALPSLAPPAEMLQPIDPAPCAEAVQLPPAPNWSRYAYAEALIMGRDNQSFNRPLLVDDLGTTTLLTTQDLQFPFGGGVRAFYGEVGCDCRGWEIGYFGLYNQVATATMTEAAAGTKLYLPGALGPQLDPSGADSATFTYRSTINNVEANVFHHFLRWNPYREAWLEVDWLTGFRYVNVDETANLGLICCGGEEAPFYRVGTTNNMFGAQVGGRARWNWQRWAIESWGKAAILGNAQRQFQDPVISAQGDLLREARSTTGVAPGMIADLNVSTIYRLTDVWGIRAGYNLIWLGGVALAPNQFDFNAATASSTLLQPNGSIFLMGANLGLEARW